MRVVYEIDEVVSQLSFHPIHWLKMELDLQGLCGLLCT
jgi:hypothetical protein